jgi:low affinity Fe/Cu permease
MKLRTQASRLSRGGSMAEQQLKGRHPIGLLERLSSRTSQLAGSTAVFAIAVVVVIGWAATGPYYHYSKTWQLIINTSTTIVTFLMVFLIQRAQNKSSLAIQLKLNELVASINGASNRLIGVEDLTEDELEALHRYYGELVALARREGNVSTSHSVEEARRLHRGKPGPTDQPAPG